MGDKITISGNIQNSNLNIKSTLTNVQQTINAIPSQDANARAELETLMGQLQKALEGLPEPLKEQGEAVALSAQALVENARSESPNTTLLDISGKGLKQAAATLSGAAPAAAEIASSIAVAVLRLRGFA